MARREDNLKNGDGFDTHPERINRKGRPPKLMTTLVRELKKEGHERATAATVAETIEYLIALPQEKLVELGKDEGQPMSVRIIIKQLLGAKGFEALSAVLDRAHGKARQQMEHTGPEGGPIQTIIRFVDDSNDADNIG